MMHILSKYSLLNLKRESVQDSPYMADQLLEMNIYKIMFETTNVMFLVTHIKHDMVEYL